MDNGFAWDYHISFVQDVSQLAMGCFGLMDSCDHNAHMVVYELCQSYGRIIDDDR